MDLKELCDVVCKEVVKKTLHDKMNTEVQRVKFLMQLL